MPSWRAGGLRNASRKEHRHAPARAYRGAAHHRHGWRTPTGRCRSGRVFVVGGRAARRAVLHQQCGRTQRRCQRAACIFYATLGDGPPAAPPRRPRATGADADAGTASRSAAGSKSLPTGSASSLETKPTRSVTPRDAGSGLASRCALSSSIGGVAEISPNISRVTLCLTEPGGDQVVTVKGSHQIPGIITNSRYKGNCELKLVNISPSLALVIRLTRVRDFKEFSSNLLILREI